MSSPSCPEEHWIKPRAILNVGGARFETFVDTLTRGSTYFHSMVDSIERQQRFRPSSSPVDPINLFVDRNPEAFRHVLNYLRDKNYPVPSEALLEFAFYGIPLPTKSAFTEEIRMSSKYLAAPPPSRHDWPCASENKLVSLSEREFNSPKWSWAVTENLLNCDVLSSISIHIHLRQQSPSPITVSNSTGYEVWQPIDFLRKRYTCWKSIRIFQNGVLWESFTPSLLFMLDHLTLSPSQREQQYVQDQQDTLVIRLPLWFDPLEQAMTVVGGSFNKPVYNRALPLFAQWASAFTIELEMAVTLHEYLDVECHACAGFLEPKKKL